MEAARAKNTHQGEKHGEFGLINKGFSKSFSTTSKTP